MFFHFFLFSRRFSVKCCAKCRTGIAANEMVMRARDLVYHMTCFTCILCHKSLMPGDYFGMRDNTIYCREDYEGILQGYSPGMGLQSPTPGTIPIDNIPYFTGPKRTQKGRPRKRKIVAPEGNGFSPRPMGKIVFVFKVSCHFTIVTWRPSTLKVLDSRL